MADPMTPQKNRKLSSLYCRANGFLLGCFQVLIRYNFAREDFSIRRGRMVEFLQEAKIPVSVPTTHDDYGKTSDRLMNRIWESHFLALTGAR